MTKNNERSYLRALCEEVTLDDFREIVRAAKKAALEGDAQARLFLTAFLCGMPHGSAPRMSVLDSLDQNDELMHQLTGGVL